MCVLAGKNIGRHRRTHEQEIISAATFKMEEKLYLINKIIFLLNLYFSPSIADSIGVFHYIRH